MAQTSRTIINILLPSEERFSGYEHLFFKDGDIPERHPGKGARGIPPLSRSHVVDITRPHYDAEADCLVIPAGTRCSLSAYLSMFSAAKWFRYTSIESVSLELDIEGMFDLTFVSHRLRDMRQTSESTTIYANDRHLPVVSTPYPEGRHQFAQRTPLSVALPEKLYGSTLVGFEIVAVDEVRFYSGRWVATIEEERLNPVELAISTTTFNNEDLIMRNIEMLRRDVFGAGDELSRHFQFFIVDNGRTLDHQALSYGGVHVFPNANAGGAGGFSRGMIEASRAATEPTNLIIMDDDVLILPESLKRTYALLTMMRQEYRDCYISGAMLRMEEMDIQHEDIGFIHTAGFWHSKKDIRDVGTIDGCAADEIAWPDFGFEYAAWWYCCIPMHFISLRSLPIPLFVRGDDIEYSLRNQARVISMNGICVWHMGFNARYNAPMDIYMGSRNALILRAFHPDCYGIAVIDNLKLQHHRFLSELAYDYADLILDAVEDFLSGPEVVEQPDILDTIKAKGHFKEQLKPIDEVYDGAVPDMLHYEEEPLSFAKVKILNRSYNGQKFMKNLVGDETGFALYDANYHPDSIYMKKQILAVNPYLGTAVMRERDPERFTEVHARALKVFGEYDARHEQVERDYVARYPYITSYEFWKGYLGLTD